MVCFPAAERSAALVGARRIACGAQRRAFLRHLPGIESGEARSGGRPEVGVASANHGNSWQNISPDHRASYPLARAEGECLSLRREIVACIRYFWEASPALFV